MTAAPETVTVALCATLGYDPDGYDLEQVRGKFKGVRVTNAAGPVTFIKQADLDRRMKEPGFVSAFQRNLQQAEKQRTNHERARRVLTPAVDAVATLAAWLAVGWRTAAGR